MARIDNLTNFLTDVADSIRSKTGKSETIAAEDFDTEIESIETGGTLQSKSITITENGTTSITPDTGYDGLSDVSVTTDVSGGGETVYINDASYLFYSNARKDQVEELLPLLKNVTSTYQMFYNANQCNASVDLSHGELNSLNQVNTFYQMFSTAALKSVKLSSTYTGANNFNKMFSGCAHIQTIDLSGITAASTLSNYGGQSIFDNCQKLTDLKLPINFFSDNSGSKYEYAFRKCYLLGTINNESFGTFVEKINLTYIPTAMFEECRKLNCKTLSDTVTYIQWEAFQSCPIVQLSANNIQYINGNNSSRGALAYCRSLKAVWLGSAFVGSNNQTYAFYYSTLAYIYINRPRANVEQIPGYSVAWMGIASQAAGVTIICNDDAGFMSKADFDAKDWSTYTP